MTTAFPDALLPEMAAILDELAAEAPASDWKTLPAAEGRRLSIQSHARWNRDLPPLDRVAEVIVPADAALGSADCRVVVLVPPGAGRGAVLYAHGGGFAFGTPETHRRIGHVLARETGLPVLMPDYRLAPEHPYPAGLKDVIACLRAAFTATGLPPGPLFVAGDSAGAALVTSAMLHEHAAGRPLPAGGLLFYGVFGADFETPSYRHFAHGPGLATDEMQVFWDWYTTAPDRATDPLVSPVAASDDALRALPPLHLLAAGIDPLLSDTLIFAERLKGAGRDDELRLVEGVVHGYLKMIDVLPAANESLAAAGAAVKRWLHS